MKTRQIGLVLAALAVAGLWFGRLAWRAHHNLVTLHVRNMPLAKVVRSMEWQTWEKIRFDKSMNSRITLNIEDMPLAGALDLVADRAGARWQKTYAVGVTDAAMKGLESVLDGAAKLGAAGWTNLAPQFSEDEHPNIPDSNPGPQDGNQRQLVHKFIRRGEGQKPGGGSSPGGTGGGMTMMTISPDGSIDRWSSERLVLETSLFPLLNADPPSEVTAESASRVAAAVHGRSYLYYALEKAPFEGGRLRPPLNGSRKAGPGPVDFSDPGAGMAQERRQQRLRELSRSPEEQVERARQHGPGKMQIVTGDETN